MTGTIFVFLNAPIKLVTDQTPSPRTPSKKSCKKLGSVHNWGGRAPRPPSVCALVSGQIAWSHLKHVTASLLYERIGMYSQQTGYNACGQRLGQKSRSW